MDVLAPDILLGPAVHQRDLEGMYGDDTAGPGSGHAGACNRHLHAEEILRVEFVAAPLGRLQREEEAGFHQGIYVFLRHPAFQPCLFGVVAKQGLQSLNPVEHLGAGSGALSVPGCQG